MLPPYHQVDESHAGGGSALDRLCLRGREQSGQLLNRGARCCATARTLGAGLSKAGQEKRLMIGGIEFGRGTGVVRCLTSFSRLRGPHL